MHAEADYNRLKAGLAVDLLRIDEELMRQPMEMQAAAEIAAEAMRIRDGLAHELLVEKAAAARMLRDVEVDGKKPSETAVQTQVPLNKAVRKAQEAVDEADYDLKLWQSMVRAYEEKGSNIRRVGEMMVAGFLTTASVYQERRAAIREASDKKGKK